MKPGVRIAGGEHRGRGLAVPPGARPTEGRVREALFSIWGERLAGARLLDLFAGSGIVGLEALSRGARRVLAVDADPRAIRTIEANARLLGERPGAGAFAVRRLPLPAGLARLTEAGPFDLVYADPFYDFRAYESLLAAALPLLAPHGEIAIEHATRVDLPPEAGPLARLDTRRYGESSVSFYRC